MTNSEDKSNIAPRSRIRIRFRVRALILTTTPSIVLLRANSTRFSTVYPEERLSFTVSTLQGCTTDLTFKRRVISTDITLVARLRAVGQHVARVTLTLARQSVHHTVPCVITTLTHITGQRTRNQIGRVLSTLTLSSQQQALHSVSCFVLTLTELTCLPAVDHHHLHVCVALTFFRPGLTPLVQVSTYALSARERTLPPYFRFQAVSCASC